MRELYCRVPRRPTTISQTRVDLHTKVDMTKITLVSRLMTSSCLIVRSHSIPMLSAKSAIVPRSLLRCVNGHFQSQLNTLARVEELK